MGRVRLPSLFVMHLGVLVGDVGSRDCLDVDLWIGVVCILDVVLLSTRLVRRIERRYSDITNVGFPVSMLFRLCIWARYASPIFNLRVKHRQDKLQRGIALTRMFRNGDASWIGSCIAAGV